jgi:hypothetical protein
LREIEDAIDARRNLIINIEQRGLDAAREREHLSRLLPELDATLRLPELRAA